MDDMWGGDSPYYVWRRSDGYVSCTRRMPNNGCHTFQILLTTKVWSEAYARITSERDSKHYDVVKSWEL